MKIRYVVISQIVFFFNMIGPLHHMIDPMIVYFGLNEDHDAVEFRMGLCSFGVG